MVLVVQLQFPQTAVGVAVGDDAYHLGIAGSFIGKILDALTHAHGLRDALDIGVDAIGWYLFFLPLSVHIVEIGIVLSPDPAIDGQV